MTAASSTALETMGRIASGNHKTAFPPGRALLFRHADNRNPAEMSNMNNDKN